MKWQPIETAPSFMLILAIGVTSGNGFTGDKPFRTEPHLIYWDGGKWSKWPHHWGPTHWMEIYPLPEIPDA